ncbi:PC-esterase domain-containing protein 1B-like [Tiliqua scincoides]|uniref:PC-esterase domain-containing protein 1B-like n=1 Tax=Tiliqua scincoides TaxID=71010 RepID=UPI003461AB94
MIPLGNIYHFTPEEARQLLHNKFVVILGDSIHRAIYKDMIYFLQKKKMLTNKQLKLKTESFANDRLVEGGERHNKTSYCEARQYRTDHHLVRYYFLTRIYSAYVESILSDFKAGPPPDVVILNSCLWDLNRYNDGVSKEGHLEKAFREYWQNLHTLLGKLKEILPPDCLVIWNTAMPLGQKVQRAYLEPGMTNQATPTDILKANFYSATLACCYEFDVLDLHYSFRFLRSKLDTDGVHWDSWVHRYITNLLLTHMANAWGVEPEKKMMIQGLDWNGNVADQSSSPWPLVSLPHLRPRRPPPQHLWRRPPPRLRPRLRPPPPPPHLWPRMPPPPHLWPRMPRPPPPAPHMFQPCSEFNEDFPPSQFDENPAPFQFGPSNDPTFQCDRAPLDECNYWEDVQLSPPYAEGRFSASNNQALHCDFNSNHAPSDECINWEGDQLPPPYPEEMHHDGFWDPSLDAPNAPPYFQPEMPRGVPPGHHNDFVMRRRPYRRRPAAAPYTVPHWERPPFKKWGPSY